MRKNIFIIFLISFSLLVACNDIEQQIQEQPVDQSDTQEETVESDNEDENPAKEKQGNEKTTVSLNELTVHYLDVGQGDATLFQYADEEKQYTVLYDVGDWQGNEMVPYLEKENIDFIDLVIISHPHADHIGQLDKIMNHFEVGEVWMSGNSSNTNLFQSAME